MGNWGLVGAATANAPQQTLEDLLAARMAAEERARKIAADSVKQNIDLGKLTLDQNADARGSEYLGIAKGDRARADAAAQADALAKSLQAAEADKLMSGITDPNVRTVAGLRRAGITGIDVNDLRTPSPKPKNFTFREDSQGLMAIDPEDPMNPQRVPGFKPTPKERAQEPLESVMGPDGQAVFVPRSQAVGKRPATNSTRPATEGERNAVGFYRQMRDAIATIDLVEPAITEREMYQIQTLPQEELMGMLNRNQLSEGAKRYLRAFEQFTEARLRPVSGAAISDGEYARDRRTYAKQYGETEGISTDRGRARELALDSLRERSGVLAPKDEAKNPPPDGDMVSVVSPDGKQSGRVPKANVASLQAAGWKVK